MKNNNKGFTLAEVLITLGIIGIVAAMTIPTLMNSTNNQETVSRVKKIYSTLSQAFALAELNDGTVDTWNWVASNDGDGATNALNILAKNLHVTKNCGATTDCLPDIAYLSLDKTITASYNSSSIYAKATLNDGTILTVVSRSSNCSNVRGTNQALNAICGVVFADVNGFKGPNQIGKDMFQFYITKYGIIPMGTASETTYPPANCDKAQTGNACPAWVLEKGNLDYLK